ncbi:MAG: acyltransferase family protein [Hyphomonadaceae bacterium]|nr:acyltransferase family protein [Hyphomonadaceae bacterium]
MTLPNAVPDRRVDLDWLRIAAFGLLIFYHVGMFYVTWDWHVKSSHASTAIEPLMRASNPWRLTLLFVISGCATRFMMDKMNAGRFLGSRSVRLVLPILLGVFVIVPPQTYFQVVEQLGFSGSFGEFYGKYATASGDWAPGGETLITPTYNHLWFVVYLFVYTLLIVPVGPLLKRIPAKLAAPLASGPMVVILPWLFLTVLLLTLRPLFPETHALIDDWYNHAVCFSAFLLGYAIAKHERFFESCQRMRWTMLGFGAGAWIALETLRSTGSGFDDLTRQIVGGGLRELQAWATILALFGFARKHLRRDGPARRYLTDAIFPFYIIHQTAIVIAGYYLNKTGMPLAIEAPLLISITLASCWLGYEIVKRVGLLRPLFGLKLGANRTSPAKQPQTQAASA